MINADKLKMDLEQDPKYAGSVYMSIYDVLHQGFSDFSVEDDYDFVRLVDIFKELNYTVEADIDKLRIRITL